MFLKIAFLKKQIKSLKNTKKGVFPFLFACPKFFQQWDYGNSSLYTNTMSEIPANFYIRCFLRFLRGLLFNCIIMTSNFFFLLAAVRRCSVKRIFLKYLCRSHFLKRIAFFNRTPPVVAPVAHQSLPTSLETSYQSLVTNYQSLVVSHKAPVTSNQSQATGYLSLVACYQSLVTCHFK